MMQSVLTRRRPPRPVNPLPADPEPPDPVRDRLTNLNRIDADLATAARLLEQSHQEDYIPDYARRLNQALQEIKKARAAVAAKRYRLRSRCQAGPAPLPAATPEFRDRHG